MLTASFWRATVERMLRTFAQVLLAALGLNSAGVVHANWADGLSLAGGAAVLTLLTAMAASSPGPDGPGLAETTTCTGRED